MVFSGIIFIIYVCVYIMPTQKQRQERLEILAEKWKTNMESGCSEVLNRKLCDDMMKQVWFLGHQTREDYLEIVSSLDYRRKLPNE